MRKVLYDPEMERKLAVIKRILINDIKVDLAGFSASVQDRALQKRLFRFWYRKTKSAVP